MLEVAVVLEHRDLRPRRVACADVDVGDDHAGVFPRLAQDAAPRIDDEAVAIGLAAVLMPPALGGGEDEGAGLDRPGPQEDVPVRLAGLPGEGRWNGEHLRAGVGERAEELREPGS